MTASICFDYWNASLLDTSSTYGTRLVFLYFTGQNIHTALTDLLFSFDFRNERYKLNIRPCKVNNLFLILLFLKYRDGGRHFIFIFY